MTDWYAVMFLADGRIDVVRTETANYIRCYEMVFQDGRVQREAHVEADSKDDAIAKAIEILADQYSLDINDYQQNS